MNSIVSANQVADWVWNGWLDPIQDRKIQLGVTQFSTFCEWVTRVEQCRWASLLRKLANGLKHLEVTRGGPVPQTGQQLMPTGIPLFFNHEEAFVVEHDGQKLIVLWMISDLMEFWRRFFEQHKDWDT
jgi:hypothetical protein